MKQCKKMADIRISSTWRRLFQGISLALCFVTIVASVGCLSKRKADDAQIVSADAAYFSTEKLDYYETEEGEESQLISVMPFKEQMALLLRISTTPEMEPEIPNKYIVLFYDNSGKLSSQVDISSAFDSSDNVINMTCDSEGHLAVLASGYEEATFESSFSLHVFDTAGKLTEEPIQLSIDEGDVPEKIVIDKSGRLYFAGPGIQGETKITILDSEGQLINDISSETGIHLAGNIFALNGIVYADAYLEAEEEYKYVFYPFDGTSGTIGAAIDMSICISMGVPGLSAGNEGLFYSDTTGVYALDLLTQQKTPVLLWKDTDIEKNSNFGEEEIFVLSEDKIMVVSTSYSQESVKNDVSLLTHQEKNPNAGKRIITIAGVGISYNSKVTSAVYNFNRENKEYRVEILDYIANQYITTEEDYYSVISSMNLDILSGNCPDIIYGTNESFSSYEAKGLLVDLYTLMEKDSTFTKDDYIPSIFNVCETDGHLYKLATSFKILGYAGARSVIGTRAGWTVDEFVEMTKLLPDKMTPVYCQTQKDMLGSSLQASMDAFVDFAAGEVSFNSNEFCQLLDYAKTYGITDEMQEKMQSGYFVSSDTKMKNGELALMSAIISGPSSYFSLVCLAGEPISVTGYPSADKRGPMCSMDAMLAISSESASQQASWLFIKSFFTEDAQKTSADFENSSIPVLKSAFESQIELAMNPDENFSGGMVMMDGNGMSVSSSTTTIPMTEEAVQAYRELVYSLNTLGSYDPAILNLIREEVPFYFNGQKSDKDVASLIQNRVQTLVDERQ